MLPKNVAKTMPNHQE